MDGHSNGSTASLEDCTAAFRQAPQDLLLARASIDGDVSQFRLGGDVYCSIASPLLARQVFLGDPLLLRKGNLYDIPRRMLGDGMFTDEWEEWTDHRNLRGANFSKSKITAHTATIVAALTRWVGTWEEGARAGAVVDPFRGGRRFAFEVVLRTLFNIPASADTAALFEAAEQVVGVEHVTVDRLLAQLSPSSRVFELFASSAQSVALERMDTLVCEFIDQRLAAPEQPDDLLAAAISRQRLSECTPDHPR